MQFFNAKNAEFISYIKDAVFPVELEMHDGYYRAVKCPAFRISERAIAKYFDYYTQERLLALENEPGVSMRVVEPSIIDYSTLGSLFRYTPRTLLKFFESYGGPDILQFYPRTTPGLQHIVIEALPNTWPEPNEIFDNIPATWAVSALLFSPGATAMRISSAGFTLRDRDAVRRLFPGSVLSEYCVY